MVRSLGAMDRWIGRSDRYRIVRSVSAMDLLIGRSVDQIDKLVRSVGTMDRKIGSLAGADPHRFPPVYGNRSDFSR